MDIRPAIILHAYVHLYVKQCVQSYLIEDKASSLLKPCSFTHDRQQVSCSQKHKQAKTRRFKKARIKRASLRKAPLLLY